jgi:enterochelin esterase-like enzyme
VLEPQGTVFFLLLMVAFAALLVWVALAKQVVFRIFAACLAFLPAMVFGIAAVNKYYDYYQTWGSLVSDLSDSGSASIPKVSAAGLDGGSIDTQLGQSADTAEASTLGYLFQTAVTASNITRDVYVWLPPQYFQSSYKAYHFPVIELLHGSPGDPSAWVNVMDVDALFLQLMSENKADPAVVVMPDTDGGERYALQCLNYPGMKDLQDMTYVGVDVPDYIAKELRVQPPGRAWAVAGYSEGGYCAANIGMQYPDRWGYVGSLSGYFTLQGNPSQIPANGKANGKPVVYAPYKHDYAEFVRNSPALYVLKLPIGVQIPQFWLAAGNEDAGDVQGLEQFQQLLQTRLASVPIDIVQGGGHQAKVWRAALTPMLEYMTPGLQNWAQRDDVAAAEAAASAKHHTTRTKATPSPSTTPATKRT